MYAVDVDELEEIPLKSVNYGSQSKPWTQEGIYDFSFQNHANLLGVLEEPSLFELPYRTEVQFELPGNFLDDLVYTTFKPLRYNKNKEYKFGTGSTYMQVHIKYNYADGSVGYDHYYDYNTNYGGIYCDYANWSGANVVTVKYTIETMYYNSVDMLGFGINIGFEQLSRNIDRSVIFRLKTDSEEMQVLRTIEKNTKNTSDNSGSILDILRNLGGWFVDLGDTIVSGITNLGDTIGKFISDLLQGIKDFFQWLFIPTTEDIQAVIDTFQEFWGDTPLLIPFQFVSRILESFNNIDFVNGYQWSFTLPRWYLNINGSNYRVWNNTTIQPFNTDSGIYYIVKHDFSSGQYPYISANSARLGLYWAFWLFVTFKTMMKFAEKLGILDFISTDETQEMLGG